MFQDLCVWWCAGHAWWSLGSLRPDYWPANQLVGHMGGSCSLVISPRPTSVPESLLTTALLLTFSFFLMNRQLHLHQSENSTLVCHAGLYFLLFNGDLEDQAWPWCMEIIRRDEILITPLPKCSCCIINEQYKEKMESEAFWKAVRSFDRGCIFSPQQCCVALKEHFDQSATSD